MVKGRERITNAIRTILVEEWDPIGVRTLPESHHEYDGYVPGIRRLLDAGADRAKIVDRLRQLETVSMGLTDRGDGTRGRVAELLIAIYRR